MQRPRIAMTLGDVAGIGPEVVVRACANERVRQWCRPLVVGHADVLARAAELVGMSLPLQRVDALEQIDWQAAAVPCWNPSVVQADRVAAGTVTADAGQAAYDYLVAATRAALAGAIDAITTAPLNKGALHLAGLAYPGHTEILAHECGVAEFAMMLFLPASEAVRSPHGLGVAHVTLHTSIRSVPALLTTDRVRETIGLVERFMRSVGCPRPRVGVCALNPHAGEEGLFGDEEARIIAPAVRQSQQAGIEAAGPFPADTLLKRAVAGEFDGIAAMYHDQGHIALKLIAFDRAVNVTLGLPIVRTSPSHGTAFDIAWTGQARAEGMMEAVRTAALLAGRTIED